MNGGPRARRGRRSPGALADNSHGASIRHDVPTVRRSSAVSILVCAALAGCGLNVNSPDLFLLTRTGQGRTLTMLVNDGGTIRCNGGKTKSLPDQLLLNARDLANQLDSDAKQGLHIPRSARSVFFYTVRLQDGAISFPDTAAAKHSELASAEQFVLQAAATCGVSA